MLLIDIADRYDLAITSLESGAGIDHSPPAGGDKA
jgi:hypothetical protein